MTTLLDTDMDIEISTGTVTTTATTIVQKTTHEKIGHGTTDVNNVVDVVPGIHTDPFAYREGKTLTWKNIHMTLVCR
jgi:hypothetical protein